MGCLLFSRFYFLNSRGGQATIYLAFLVGGTAILVAATLAFLVASFGATTGGYQAANRAISLVSSGAEDAILQLVRNKNFSHAGYQFPACPSCTPPPPQALVVVTNPRPGTTDQVLITVTATVGRSQRKIEVIVSLDPKTARISLVSWKQVPI